jgi:CRISPR-associated protein Cmr4
LATNNKHQTMSNNRKILYLFTRTPLHVGAGDSVGAIDQPIQRERHTGFPIIPASSLKGTFADAWDAELEQDGQRFLRITARKNERDEFVPHEVRDAAWLFGSNNVKVAFTGALQFSEARLLAFPIRSAKGSFAWITCPLMLQRAKRDGVISGDIPDEPKDNEAIFKPDGPLALNDQIVLEEYCFTHTGTYPASLANAIADLVPDELFKCIADRLVILSNGMMSHFATTACEVAQHVRISDQTGTAEGTGLFNQENVPADTLFYSVLTATNSRVPSGELKGKPADDALQAFANKVSEGPVFQFGGDASTGLGFCTVTTNSEVKGA